MPRTCSICGHAKRGEIEAALAAGDSTRKVAARFGLSQPSVQRHKACAGKRVEAEPEHAEPVQAESNGDETDARARVSSEPPKRHRSTAGQLDAVLLEAEAVRLRLARKNYREIAAELGSTPGACCAAVHRVLKRTMAEADDTAPMLRALELEGLDTMESSLWGRATNPACAVVMVPADTEAGCRPYDGQDKAIDRIIKIKERRAELLGLDATKRVDVTSAGQPIGLASDHPLTKLGRPPTPEELDAYATTGRLPELPN